MPTFPGSPDHAPHRGLDLPVVVAWLRHLGWSHGRQLRASMPYLGVTMHYSVNEADDSHIAVELDSPNGPRVTAPADADADDILAALPVGWTVHPDDWQSQVTLLGGRHAYPLSRDDGGTW